MRKVYRDVQDFFETNFPNWNRDLKEEESDIQSYINNSSAAFSRRIKTLMEKKHVAGSGG